MDLLDKRQAAELRGVTRQTIENWIAAGLPVQRFGRAVLIKRRDLMRWKPRARGNPNFGAGK